MANTSILAAFERLIYFIKAALNTKVDVSELDNIQTQLDGKSPSNHSHSAATTTASGFLSSADKAKLDGISEDADSVSWTRNVSLGTKIGTITINGTGTDIYVPNDTNTKNTAGSTNSSKKLYLVGAESQAANPQTYSHDTAYVGTDGCLYSGGEKVLTEHPDITISESTPKTTTLTHGGTFPVVESITRDDDGHVTDVGLNAVTLPAQYSHPTYTARTGVPTNNQTPAFGGTFEISQPVSNGTGHITAINSKTVTIPNTTATIDTAGLMSASDKIKLNNGGTIVTTSGTGAAYTATVGGISTLEKGMRITIIPHANSTTTTPTLNINALGAKYACVVQYVYGNCWPSCCMASFW